MKKILSSIVLFSMLVSMFVACGATPEAESKITGEPATQSEGKDEKDPYFYQTLDPADFDPTRYAGELYLNGEYVGKYGDTLEDFKEKGLDATNLTNDEYVLADYTAVYTGEYDSVSLRVLQEDGTYGANNSNWDGGRKSSATYVDSGDETIMGESRLGQIFMEPRLTDEKYVLLPHPWTDEEMVKLTPEIVYNAFGAPANIVLPDGPEKSTQITYQYYYPEFSLQIAFQRGSEEGPEEFQAFYIHYTDYIIYPETREKARELGVLE